MKGSAYAYSTVNVSGKKYDGSVHNTSSDLERSELKTDTPGRRVLMLTMILYAMAFLLSTYEPVAYRLQTDGRWDGQDPYCGFLGWLHNKSKVKRKVKIGYIIAHTKA